VQKLGQLLADFVQTFRPVAKMVSIAGIFCPGLKLFYIFALLCFALLCFQCFDTVGWVGHLACKNSLMPAIPKGLYLVTFEISIPAWSDLQKNRLV